MLTAIKKTSAPVFELNNKEVNHAEQIVNELREKGINEIQDAISQRRALKVKGWEKQQQNNARVVAKAAAARLAGM